MISRQTLRPQNNVPLVVKLDKGPEGKETSKGDYQYTVNDDAAIMWVPVEARSAILRSHAHAGDEIEILKSPRGWTVQVLADSAEPEPEPPARQMRVVAGHRNGATARQQHSNGATALAPQPQQQSAQQTSYPVEGLLVKLYIAAAHALRAAHEQLIGEGFELEPPNWEDIRSTGTSLFIERNRREERASR